VRRAYIGISGQSLGIPHEIVNKYDSIVRSPL
jgi:hypothetical protein